MIPPPASVNDAIGLLAALGNPDTTKASLDEMRKHSETAQDALAKAQEQTRIADTRWRDQLAMADKFGKEKMTFAEEQTRKATEWQTANKALDERARGLNAREQELKLLQDRVDADKGSLADQMKGLERDAAALGAREKALDAREAKLTEQIALLGPLAKKLGLG